MTSRFYVAALTMLAGLFFALPSGFAQDLRPQRVLIAPQLQVFAADDEDSPEDLRQAVYAGFSSYIRADAESFTLVDAEALEARLTERPLFEGTVALAKQWGEMGLESYKRLETKEAIAQFEKAVENYATVHYGMFAPADLADILFY